MVRYVHAGDVLAKLARATTKTKDITGGLPRVVELFEARKPHDPAIIAEMNGSILFGDLVKGFSKISSTGDDGTVKELFRAACRAISRKAKRLRPAIL